MQYPLTSEYIKAIRDAADNLDKLAHLTPVLDNYGEPYRSSGAFAVVFKMKDEATGKFYALKCFTEEQTDREDAYRMIAEELETIGSQYLTGVQYLDKELFVDSQCTDETEFPILLMDWVDGVTMETYIAENYTDSYAMAMLCHQFCRMASWLRSQPIAHGDIKLDNIMVRDDGSLVLVDYDGMFVPAMKGRKSPTIGTRDFSHPLRSVDDFDETIDDFSLACIALSLKATALKPTLLDDFGAPDRLLFTADDYRNPANSRALSALNELLADAELQSLYSLFLMSLSSKSLAMVSFRAFAVAKPVKYNDAKIQSLENAADAGDAIAKFNMGNMYYYGKGVRQNYEKAGEWYKKAREQGKDDDQFINWLLNNAKQGNSAAQNMLGHMYDDGLGVTQNYEMAVEWYKKSAEQGNAFAQFYLGNHYYNGQGVKQDYAKAVDWYRKAAEQGDADAQYNLGYMYYKGLGVTQDYEKAGDWFRKPAEQGFPIAQFNLGFMYENGQGIKQDYVKAVEWYRKAAEQGLANAQFNLGVMYENGQGVKQDKEKAVEWYSKAAEQGDANAQYYIIIDKA
ncbi:MAG: SEL1-like repeat protein [Bacteroidales bacterium]|nr:SEL1-like repeat protein [Bacteroidales bacterium]